MRRLRLQLPSSTYQKLSITPRRAPRLSLHPHHYPIPVTTSFPIKHFSSSAIFTAPSPPPAATNAADVNATTTSPSPRFSEGTDPTTALPILNRLLDKSGSKQDKDKDGSSLVNWKLTEDAIGVRRRYKFKSFKITWEFMDAVARQCMVERHHPEWTNSYNTVDITWTTHIPLGLSMKDLKMAQFCDEQAVIYCEKAP